MPRGSRISFYLMLTAVAARMLAAQPASPPTTCPPSPPASFEDAARLSLQKEWLDDKSVDYALRAVALYVTNVDPTPPPRELDPINADKAAIDALAGGNAALRNLYLSAQGLPNASGHPTAQGLTGFLDSLIKANTLCTAKMEPGDLNSLFVRAQKLIDGIFAYELGAGAGQSPNLLNVSGSFADHLPQTAVYQLLAAARASGATAADLETLRAAYEADTGLSQLPAMVSKKIAGK